MVQITPGANQAAQNLPLPAVVLVDPLTGIPYGGSGSSSTGSGGDVTAQTAMGSLSQGRVSTTAPTNVNGTRAAISLDTEGNLRVASVSGALPAGTDRSGSAATSSGTVAAANTARRGMDIQNIGANNIGINEFGGTAAIGTAGTYTLAPGATMRVKTNRAITAIAATGATAFTATEW